MKYILMCGSIDMGLNGLPRQLLTVNGERILDRTIRLLRENGIDDIYITTSHEIFKTCDAEIIEYNSISDMWTSAFYPTNEPTCYIFGDVFFSPEAIKTIVETETDDIQFFASAPPFGDKYPKKFAEPFAFKVVNTERFFNCIERTNQLWRIGKFKRWPIAWELWQVIKGTQPNIINYHNYVAINDYTCDVDTWHGKGAQELEQLQKLFSKVHIMIHVCPKRIWYVEGYLIPKLKEQGIENITVWEDKDHKGNLESCMQSFLSLPEKGNTWHLQDDVVISKEFRQLAEAYDNGRRIACGINTLYDGFVRGTTALCNMWYSFPCIYIPNKMARECAEWWYEKDRSGHKELKGIVEYGNGDDSVFRLFLHDKYPDIYVQNVYPNMVDHIDYLIGGSQIHTTRKQKEVRARWWNELDVINDLQNWLFTHRPDHNHCG